MVENNMGIANLTSLIEEVDTFKNERNLKTYTSLEQLGITAPTTMQKVFMALPNSSTLYYASENIELGITDLPEKCGILIIEKSINGNGRFSILFKMSFGGSVGTNSIYIGQLKGSDGSGIVWNKLVTDTELQAVNDSLSETVEKQYVLDYDNLQILPSNNESALTFTPNKSGLMIVNTDYQYCQIAYIDDVLTGIRLVCSVNSNSYTFVNAIVNKGRQYSYTGRTAKFIPYK